MGSAASSSFDFSSLKISDDRKVLLENEQILLLEEVLTEVCTHRAVLDSIFLAQDGKSVVAFSSGDQIVGNGSLDLLKYSINSNPNISFTPKAMDHSAGLGHIDIVEYLHQNRTEGCTVEAMNLAAKNGHLNVVEWLHYNRTEGCNKDALTFACRFGHFKVAEWLHEHRTEGAASFTVKVTSMQGYTDIVEWIHKNRDHPNFEGMKFRRSSCIASENGHLDTAAYLCQIEKRDDERGPTNEIEVDATPVAGGRSHGFFDSPSTSHELS